MVHDQKILRQFIPSFQNFVQFDDFKETVRLWNNWEDINTTEESSLKVSREDTEDLFENKFFKTIFGEQT